jgi:hypothetical protein
MRSTLEVFDLKRSETVPTELTQSIRQWSSWFGDTNPVIGKRSMQRRIFESRHVAGNAKFDSNRASRANVIRTFLGASFRVTLKTA